MPPPASKMPRESDPVEHAGSPTQSKNPINKDMFTQLEIIDDFPGHTAPGRATTFVVRSKDSEATPNRIVHDRYDQHPSTLPRVVEGTCNEHGPVGDYKTAFMESGQTAATTFEAIQYGPEESEAETELDFDNDHALRSTGKAFSIKTKGRVFRFAGGYVSEVFKQEPAGFEAVDKDKSNKGKHVRETTPSSRETTPSFREATPRFDRPHKAPRRGVPVPSVLQPNSCPHVEPFKQPAPRQSDYPPQKEGEEQQEPQKKSAVMQYEPGDSTIVLGIFGTFGM